jgi:hypothetical protein
MGLTQRRADPGCRSDITHKPIHHVPLPVAVRAQVEDATLRLR